MKPTLQDLVIIAKQAGVILKQGYGQRHQISSKSHAIDLVTETDRRSEEFLLNAIQGKWASHTIVAEESGTHKGNENLWFVDPLDGTVNFAHGVPIFSVSIAYAENGKVKMGVVYNPMSDECFYAQRGLGAYLNGRQIHVSATQTLAQALLVTGFPYDIWENPENNLDYFARFALRTQGVRRLGSAALDLCFVAAGRFDGYWELRLKPWDVAAGGLIAEEAGAIVTNLHGEEDYISPPQSILAANPSIHPQMLKTLHEDN